MKGVYIKALETAVKGNLLELPEGCGWVNSCGSRFQRKQSSPWCTRFREEQGQQRHLRNEI